MSLLGPCRRVPLAHRGAPSAAAAPRRRRIGAQLAEFVVAIAAAAADDARAWRRRLGGIARGGGRRAMRRYSLTVVGMAMPVTVVTGARPALVRSATGPPDLDHFGLDGGRRRGCSSRPWRGVGDRGGLCRCLHGGFLRCFRRCRLGRSGRRGRPLQIRRRFALQQRRPFGDRRDFGKRRGRYGVVNRLRRRRGGGLCAGGNFRFGGRNFGGRASRGVSRGFCGDLWRCSFRPCSLQGCSFGGRGFGWRGLDRHRLRRQRRRASPCDSRARAGSRRNPRRPIRSARSSPASPQNRGHRTRRRALSPGEASRHDSAGRMRSASRSRISTRTARSPHCR